MKISLKKGRLIDWLEVIVNEHPASLKGPVYQRDRKSKRANEELRGWDVGKRRVEVGIQDTVLQKPVSWAVTPYTVFGKRRHFILEKLNNLKKNELKLRWWSKLIPNACQQNIIGDKDMSFTSSLVHHLSIHPPNDMLKHILGTRCDEWGRKEYKVDTTETEVALK